MVYLSAMSEENMENATTTVELLQKVDKMLNYLVAKQTKEDEAEAAKKELEAAELFGIGCKSKCGQFPWVINLKQIF